jgi:restriction endonuclease S subunit
LGAKRTPIKENDFPCILQNFQDFKNGIERDHASIQKEIINESGDYSLSLSKFQREEVSSNFPVVKLSEIIEILDSKRKPLKKSDRVQGDFPYYGATGIIDYVDNYIFDEKLVLVGEDGAKWGEGDKSAFIAEGKYWVNNHAHVIKPLRDKILDFYLVQVLNKMDLLPHITGVTVPKLNQANLLSIQIPLPPLEIQQEIVDELEGYQKIIDGCKQVVENYKPTIDIDPSWEMVELGEVCESNLDSKRIPITKSDREEGDIPYYGASGIVDYVKDFIFDEELLLVSEDGANLKDRNYPIAFSISGKSWVNNHAHVLKFGSYENQKFIEFYLNNISLEPYITGAAQPKVNQSALNSIKVPNPSMNIQKEIVKKIEEERKVIEGNKKLIEIYTQKIQDRINKVWGEG